MPQTTVQIKKVVVSLAGDPNDQLFEIDVEAGATPASVFEAMGLERDGNNQFPYQITKPGPNKGVFGDKENMFPTVQNGDKLVVVPKNPVAAVR